MEKRKSIGQYEKTNWPGFDNNFDKPNLCIWYVRGTSELIQQSKDYYYFDHAYLFGNKHSHQKR